MSPAWEREVPVMDLRCVLGFLLIPGVPLVSLGFAGYVAYRVWRWARDRQWREGARIGGIFALSMIAFLFSMNVVMSVPSLVAWLIFGVEVNMYYLSLFWLDEPPGDVYVVWCDVFAR